MYSQLHTEHRNMITKQHIEQTRTDLKNRIDEYLDELLLNLEEPDYIQLKRAYWKDDFIVVEFDSNVDINIRYGYDDVVHEVEDYIDKIDQSDGSFSIGINEPDKFWWVQLFSEEIETGELVVGPKPKHKPDKKIWLGWWDSYKASDVRNGCVNMLPSAGREWIDSALEYSDKVIPMIGGFGDTGNAKTNHQIEGRVEAYAGVCEDYKDKIAYIITQDEPYGRGGFSNEQVKLLCDTASQLPVKNCITITRSTALSKERILPESADIIQVQAFPFFRDLEGYVQIKTREQFFEYWDEVIKGIQGKTDADIIISPQVFKDHKWRQPPSYSPEWYYELAKEYNVIGLMFYAWHDKAGAVGLNKMPELHESVQKVFKQQGLGITF